MTNPTYENNSLLFITTPNTCIHQHQLENYYNYTLKMFIIMKQAQRLKTVRAEKNISLTLQLVKANSGRFVSSYQLRLLKKRKIMTFLKYFCTRIFCSYVPVGNSNMN